MVSRSLAHVLCGFAAFVVFPRPFFLAYCRAWDCVQQRDLADWSMLNWGYAWYPPIFNTKFTFFQSFLFFVLLLSASVNGELGSCLEAASNLGSVPCTANDIVIAKVRELIASSRF
jgi:hypothetical protein